MHGLITKDPGLHSDIILDEKSYHKLYTDPYNWANVIQLQALRSTTCFFIGFSMTDPNQRRLLEIACRDNDNSENSNSHYVFLQKEPLKGEASLSVNNEHWKEVEYLMGDFDLNVIWFENFDEIPCMIDYISGKNNVKPKEHVI